MIRVPWVSAMVHYLSDGDECRAACVTAFAAADETDDGQGARGPGGNPLGLTLHLKIMYPFGDMVALSVPYRPFEQGAHDDGAWHWPDHQRTPVRAAAPPPPPALSPRPVPRHREPLDSALPPKSMLRRLVLPKPAIVVIHDAGRPDLGVQRCSRCGHELLDRRLPAGATPPGADVDEPAWFGQGAQVLEYASGALCDRSTLRDETFEVGVLLRACLSPP